MPKQQFPILQFQGGLHTDADPRDIADNEFSALKSISVSSLGLIKSMGTMVGETNISGLNASASTGIVDITHNFSSGYGLFAFNSDYDTDGTLSPQNYLAFQDGDLTHIFGSGNWDENNFAGPLADMNPNGTSNVTNIKPSYYAPNGDLRICDGNFEKCRIDNEYMLSINT